MVSNHDQLLTDFVSQTGLERSLAYRLLQDEQWDLIGALKQYEMAVSSEQAMNDTRDAAKSIDDEEVVEIRLRTRPDSTTASSIATCPSPRCISRASNNAVLAENARNAAELGLVATVTSDCDQPWSLNPRKELFVETPSYAFILPNLNALPAEFRSFLERDIIETSTLRGLENSGHLNWWTAYGGAQRLWPLATSGDGNCLLHAASLGMWGFHDRRLILRNALHQILSRGSRRHALWRRWRWQQHSANQQAELQLSDQEWHTEWTALVRLASAQPRTTRSTDETPSCSSDQTYESLEEVHVFALAHVLKRPVIVVADTVLRNANGEELAPVPFAGIYLPLECAPSECHRYGMFASILGICRSPLVLCYDAAHFSALVTMQTTQTSSMQAVIPITDKDRRLLRLHFASDPGPDFTWWKDEADATIASTVELSEEAQLRLICTYLDIVQIPASRVSQARRDETVVKNTVENLIDRKTAHFIGEIAEHLLRRLHLHARRDRSRNRSRTRAASRSATTCPAITVAQMKQMNCIVAARLNTHAHQYMDDMVRNYLESARKRFEIQKENNAQPVRRDRFSRSFSSSSISVTCLNEQCEQPASHSTNFLCRDCFAYQKELMTSFGGTGNAANGGCSINGGIRLPLQCEYLAGNSIANASTTVKSQTMPAISTHRDCNNGDAAVLAVKPLSNEPVVTTAYAIPSPVISRIFRVSSVQGAHGVTHYYVRSSIEMEPLLEQCKSPHCSNYSNGHDRLCRRCA